MWNTQNLILTEDSATVSAVAQINDNLEVNIFPNPTTDFVELELPGSNNGTYTLNTYNTEGRKVFSTLIAVTGGFTKSTINVSNWAAGIYLLQVTNGNQQKVIRLVKK